MHTASLHRALHALTLACLLLASVHPGRARACRVDLFGATDAAWRDAVQQLTLGADDCAALHVEVEAGQALVTLIRNDGRRVARALSTPTELTEAIEALKLADPDEALPPPAAPVESSLVFVRTPTQPARRTTSVMFGLLLGVRAGVFGPVSPLVDTSLLLRIRSWEIDLITDWEVAYYEGGGTSRGPSFRGIAPALGFARRQQLGRGPLLVGARLGLGVMRPESRAARPGFVPPSALDESASLPDFTVPNEYQGRLAVFLGYVLPLHRLVRLRMELSADGVWLSSHNGGYRLGPYMALGAKLGVELGAP